jgi:hypothetical protein
VLAWVPAVVVAVVAVVAAVVVAVVVEAVVVEAVVVAVVLAYRHGLRLGPLEERCPESPLARRADICRIREIPEERARTYR